MKIYRLDSVREEDVFAGVRLGWSEGEGEVKMMRVRNGPVLKVPKREIFDRSDFPNFYTIKSSWVGDLLEKILTYYFNF
jgi:hypothetical protein